MTVAVKGIAGGCGVVDICGNFSSPGRFKIIDCTADILGALTPATHSFLNTGLV